MSIPQGSVYESRAEAAFLEGVLDWANLVDFSFEIQERRDSRAVEGMPLLLREDCASHVEAHQVLSLLLKDWPAYILG